MNAFKTWLADTPLGSAAKTFVAMIIGAALAAWIAAGDFVLDDWKAWVIAALASAVPPIINWLNPADGRYGRGSEVPPAE